MDKKTIDSAIAADDAKEIGIRNILDAANSLKFSDHNEIAENASLELDKLRMDI